MLLHTLCVTPLFSFSTYETFQNVDAQDRPNLFIANKLLPRSLSGNYAQIMFDTLKLKKKNFTTLRKKICL